ncbi:hypothetical protein CEUSTIGMA_g8754.t1 [Chlamydomonas eustigma]|uniref:Uncharacterized protein n=1 Tax=Chlamydomonas eustigma TaxID=1157962 RepID=A0A250XE17_9CHLO|nr:hypothetical protein CEUSTIGMA_g8754.t1 [Chlamydomonas eustigma]|eukprot:GAX81323.1 hypothetical protein CEUSTIGMA_g8754.t1 [Chlamydomonas eustigma]
MNPHKLVILNLIKLFAFDNLPLEVYFLAAPLFYACASMGVMVFHNLRNDPEHGNTGIGYYAEENASTELEYAKKYHNNPVREYFHFISGDRQTWGVFENQFNPTAKK